MTPSDQMIPKTSTELLETLGQANWLRHHYPVSLLIEHYEALEHQNARLREALHDMHDMATDKCIETHPDHPGKGFIDEVLEITEATLFPRKPSAS